MPPYLLRRARRQAELKGIRLQEWQGYTVLRFDEQQLEEEPGRIAAVVREALS